MRSAITATLLILATATLAVAKDKSTVRVYLPRDGVQVEADILTLGNICVVRCDDQRMLAQARALSMGRAPNLEDVLVIKRHIIMSRLASIGIPSRQIEFAGASAVSVQRRGDRIESKRLLAAAEKFLKDSRLAPVGTQWQLHKSPKQVTVPAGGPVEMTVKANQTPGRSEVRLQISVVRDGKTLATAKALYRLSYPWQQAVAAVDIPAGTALTTNNVQIISVMRDRQQKGWLPPYGKVASSSIVKGTPIEPNLLQDAKPQIAIQRNQGVTMKISTPTFIVTGMGIALQKGAVGDFIKVRNVDSKKIVTAEVLHDGTVRPLFRGIGR